MMACASRVATAAWDDAVTRSDAISTIAIAGIAITGSLNMGPSPGTKATISQCRQASGTGCLVVVGSAAAIAAAPDNAPVSHYPMAVASAGRSSTAATLSRSLIASRRYYA